MAFYLKPETDGYYTLPILDGKNYSNPMPVADGGYSINPGCLFAKKRCLDVCHVGRVLGTAALWTEPPRKLLMTKFR